MKSNSPIIKKIFLFIFVCFILVYSLQLYKVAKNYSQSYRFGDEDAHMLGGHLILKGYKPYKDFSGNHQPLTYWLPAAIQKIAPSNTLFPYVGRHRLEVFAYSIVWSIIYLVSFGPFVFFFISIFELLKYVLLGNKVLGEVWALYPFLILLGVVIKHSLSKKKISNLTIALFSVSTFAAAFSLLPLWPSLALLNLYILITNRKSPRKIFWQFFPLIIFTTILFLFTPLWDYIQNTFIDNITFVIPNMNKVSSSSDYVKMIFLPFNFLYLKFNLVKSDNLLFSSFLSFSSVYILAYKKIVSFWNTIGFAYPLKQSDNYAQAGRFSYLALDCSLHIHTHSNNKLCKREQESSDCFILVFFLVHYA